MWAVPLVQHLLDHVLTLLKSKTNRPLVRLPTRVAIYVQLHLILILGHGQLHCWVGQAAFVFFFRSAQRFFIISDMRLRAATLMWRRRRVGFAARRGRMEAPAWSSDSRAVIARSIR